MRSVKSGFVVSVLIACTVARPAFAHVSLAGPGYAGQSQVLTFSVGHGCAGADTVAIEVAIPADVTSVRGMPDVFGEVAVRTDDTFAVTAVVWTKSSARAADDLFYQLSLRAKLPDAAFTTLFFPAKQTCRAADGTETVVNWAALPEEIAAAPMDMAPEPAPALILVPVHKPGWNKFTVKDKLSSLSVFDDALIVWSGDSAYSSNPSTTDQIKAEKGVTLLSEIAAGSEIWVKY